MQDPVLADGRRQGERGLLPHRGLLPGDPQRAGPGPAAARPDHVALVEGAGAPQERALRPGPLQPSSLRLLRHPGKLLCVHSTRLFNRYKYCFFGLSDYYLLMIGNFAAVARRNAWFEETRTGRRPAQT